MWFPRIYQGDGRHDNPDVYGCLYLADREVSCVVEQLARFRGRRLVPGSLVRRGLPLALAGDRASGREPSSSTSTTRPCSSRTSSGLRTSRPEPATSLSLRRSPSTGATRDAAGLRWWSVYEALWANVTVFDRAAPALRLAEIRRLELGDPAVAAAADHLGLTGPTRIARRRQV